MRRTSTLVLLVVVLLVGFAGCAGCGTYNNLVGQEESVEEAWANVQTAYQRRSDLIPNLVNTVRAAGDFEQETLQAVTEARARATSINVSAEDVRDPEVWHNFNRHSPNFPGRLADYWLSARIIRSCGLPKDFVICRRSWRVQKIV